MGVLREAAYIESVTESNKLSGDRARTPCRVEFMKQVLPWLMKPGGRLASFSSSSRRFFSR